MDPFLLLLLGLGGAFTVLSMQVSRQRLQYWEEAAVSCGLRIVERPRGWQPQVRARAGLVSVRIEASGGRGRSPLIVVEAPAPPDFHGVMIRPQTTVEPAREIEIGDRHFDDTFFIRGPARLVLALLDAEARRLLLEAQEKSGVVITAGELRTVLSGDEKLADVLALLLAIRKRFLPPINVLQRLVANAAGDPEPGVRLQNLLLLIRELSWSPETDRALRTACSDPVPGIRLRAARELGAEAHGVLLELAESLEDDAVSAEALSIVARELPFERANAILSLALRRRRLQTASACLESIGRRGAIAVDMLAKVLERESGELAPAAARALGATASPAAEPLKEAAERSRLDRELHRATRQAIAEIQSRVHGASRGQLSLAGAEAGQLSLAEAEPGQLSLADDPAGQLSLPPEEHRA
jgi:hypothetical protein